MAKFMNYLRFENCKNAMNYYTDVFGAEIEFRIPFSSLENTEVNVEDSTMYGCFKILDNSFMCSDSGEKNVQYTDSNQMMFDFNSEDSEEVEKLKQIYFKITSDSETTIVMALEEQSWGGHMAIVRDKYDITWMFHSQPYSNNNS